MSAYISLFNMTDQGIRTAKDTAKQVQAMRQAAEAAGGGVIGIWWTLGQYDGFVIFEAPDDEKAAQLLLRSALQGTARSMTLRAFSEDEWQRIVQGLS